MNLDTGTIEVRQTTTTVRGKSVHGLGKTSAAHRRIQLDDPVPEQLRRHRNAQQTALGDLRPAAPVFTDR